MGVTSIDLQILENLVKKYNPTKVIDLGAQNNYGQPLLPAPYMSEWWKAKGILYDSIDMSDENGCQVLDLSDLQSFEPQYDFVMDFGTQEHVGKNGAFSWEAIYNCYKNKFDLCRIGGLIISENPKTGNWPGHGFQFFTQDFYKQFARIAGFDIIQLAEIAAMGNTTDGWNVLAITVKISDVFPTLEEFKTLPLNRS